MLAIAAKDLIQRSRDRSAYVMGLVAPLGLVLILNATLGSVSEQLTFDLGVVNADGGEIAAGFEQVLAGLEGEGIVAVHRLDDRGDLERLIEAGELSAGFVIDDGFSTAFQSQRATEITVIGDRSSGLAVEVARSIASGFAHEVGYLPLGEATIESMGGEAVADPGQLVMVGPEAPITLVPQATEGRGYDITTYYSISLSIFFLFFTVQFGVLSLLEEREIGTLDRLLVSPIPTGAVVAGKLGASFLLGVVTMVFLVVATTAIIGAQWGDWLAVSVLIVAGVLTAIALAALVAGVARTAEQASTYGSLLATVLGLLGGAFFPLSQAPDYLNALSYVSPHRWLLESLRDVSYGDGVSSTWQPVLLLAGFVVLAGGAGLMMAGRRLAP